MDSLCEIIPFADTIVTTEISHGLVDELFAFDCSIMDPKRPISSKTDCFFEQSVKQDLIQSIFDDLWSEIYPRFQHLIKKLAEDASKIAHVVPHSYSDLEICEEADHELDLLSAITIKPIPLQKREWSTKVNT